MKKITENEAREFIALGLFPKCEVSRDIFETVSSERDLLNLKNYSSSQGFTLYGWDDEELSDFSVPEGYKLLSLDDAIKKLSYDKSCSIRAKILGKKDEFTFTSYQDFVFWYKSVLVYKDVILLYA